ncbi:MAG: tetratricopeptide repeat protein [Thermaurantiacus sp.]
MRTTDFTGNPVSGASREAAGQADALLGRLLAFRGDPMSEVEGLLATYPDFAMAHIIRATLFAMAMEPGTEPMLRESLAALAPLEPVMTDRERGHVEVLRLWARRDWIGASERSAELTMAFPRDLLALMFGHQTDFFVGRQTELLDRITRALVHWQPGEPGQGFLLGMRAFGLEENNRFEEAEEEGRAATETFAGDAWAIHAVAHCFEMQGRPRDGIAWLNAMSADWAPDNMLAVHNWWHLALFHLEQGEHDRALALYDAQIARDVGAPALELVDAASMLWRLRLIGVDVGGRFETIADAWEAAVGEDGAGHYGFNDLHLALALAGAGRSGRAEAHLRRLEAAAARRHPHASVLAEVALPAVRAVYALAHGDPEGAGILAQRMRGASLRLGGSNAQRNLFWWTARAAAEAAGDRHRHRLLCAERLADRPGSALARALARRFAAPRPLPAAA